VARKAAEVRRGLEKRFRRLRQRGSHVIFQVGSGTVTFGYHDRVELADRQLRKVAADF
jgi:predicted RNA binding protein YcfA (HicA-like mRNA interferase family)